MRLEVNTARDEWMVADPAGGGIPQTLPLEWQLPPADAKPSGVPYLDAPQGMERRQAGTSVWTGRVVGTWAGVGRGLPAPAIDALRDSLRVPVRELALELPRYDAQLGAVNMGELQWTAALRGVFGELQWGRVVDVAASVPMLGTLARAAWGIGQAVSRIIRLGGGNPRPVVTGEPSEYRPEADAQGFAAMVSTLADPYGDLLQWYSPPTWRWYMPSWGYGERMVAELNDGTRDWWAWSVAGLAQRPADQLGRGCIPGGRGVHGRLEVVRQRGNTWRAMDSGRWQAAVTYQAPWLWEALCRPGRRAFDIDAVELRRRWRVYLQQLWLELRSKPGDVQTSALAEGKRLGFWSAVDGNVEQAGIDDVGGTCVPCQAAIALRSAQVATLRSVQAMLVEPQAPALQTDDELRAMAERARADILARPELLCRVDLDSIDRSQWRDVVRYQQEQRGCALYNAGGVQTSGGILVAGALAGSSIPLLPPTPDVEGTPGGAGGSPAGDVELDDEQSAGLLVAGLVAAAGLGLMMRKRR